MKATILLLSTIVISSPLAQASERSGDLCSKQTTQAQCEAYIAGLVEGYVASKQNYLPKQPEFESEYLARAFANRVGKSYYNNLNNKQPACLPSVVDKEKIIAYLMTSNKRQDLTQQLGDYLRENYRCNDKLARQ